MTVATVDNPTFTTSRSDADDVALAASGDRLAFERVYRTHVNRVFAVCARMVADRSAAEELTQDVFVRAWSKLSLYRGESAFTTWLHRLTVNVVLNARKSEGRNRSRFGSEPDEVDSLPHARASGWMPGMALDLDAAIAGLPPGARQVFVLHDVEGYKHDEIAAMLGIAQGTSKSQLHRVRMILRKYLSA